MRAILKERTKVIHHEVESLPFQKLLVNRNRILHPQLLRDHVQHKLLYLVTLETLILQKEEEGFFQNYPSPSLPPTSLSPSSSPSSSFSSPPLVLVVRFLKTLFRHSQLLKTAEFLDSHHNTYLPSPSSIPSSVRDYVHHLETLSSSAPIHLIFHAWVNLCDGLFGGVIIANSVRHRLGEGADSFFRYPEILDPSLDFKRALEKVHPLFLSSFQQPLDAHPWSEVEIERAVKEATKAFEFVGKIATAMESSPFYPDSSSSSSSSTSASTPSSSIDSETRATKKQKPNPPLSASDTSTATAVVSSLPPTSISSLPTNSHSVRTSA